MNEYEERELRKKEVKMMKMTAKEMFEEAGFKLIKNAPCLAYKMDDGGYITMLTFVEVRKRIIIEEYEEYNDHQPQGSTIMHIDMLKAINQQCKELGWV